MAVHTTVTTLIDRFVRPLTLTTTPEGGAGGFGWTVADTSAAGAPTYATQSGGFMRLLLAADAEVENVCMFGNDVLSFELGKLHNFWLVARFAGLASASTITWGLGSARNDTPDTVTTNCYFRVEGVTSLTNVVIETDDGTDNDDNATGAVIGTGWKKYSINFIEGGLGNVKFNIDGDPVGRSETMVMSGVASTTNLQPLIQVQKTSSTDVPRMDIAELGIQFEESWAA